MIKFLFIESECRAINFKKLQLFPEEITFRISFRLKTDSTND